MSALGGSNVQYLGEVNRGHELCPLYRGCLLFGGSVNRGFTGIGYNYGFHGHSNLNCWYIELCHVTYTCMECSYYSKHSLMGKCSSRY